MYEQWHEDTLYTKQVYLLRVTVIIMSSIIISTVIKGAGSPFCSLLFSL